MTGPALMIHETYVNETRGHLIGESGWYEPWTDDRGRLFREMQREYGRCVSRMYRDVPGRPPVTVGWVFSRRERYEDARPDAYSGRYRDNDHYTREVWIELREATS